MNLNRRIEILSELGNHLTFDNSELSENIEKANLANPWFTIPNIELSINSIKVNFLDYNKLTEWANKYQISEENSDRKIGIICAGNIPLVGFHDLVCAFICGQNVQIKLSSKDSVLMKYVIKKLIEIDFEVGNLISEVERLNDADAVIATGSNNTFRYFEYYFRAKPNILRKNRNGVSVLNGNESTEDIEKLAFDIQSYFGLGCRNVTKLYVPIEYNFTELIETLNKNQNVSFHSKYMNNYDYNLATLMINRDKFIKGDNIILTENQSYIARIAMLNYEYYDDLGAIKTKLENDQDKIQVIITSKGSDFGFKNEFGFGQSQSPELQDYADDVDTMKFLTQ